MHILKKYYYLQLVTEVTTVLYSCCMKSKLLMQRTLEMWTEIKKEKCDQKAAAEAGCSSLNAPVSLSRGGQTEQSIMRVFALVRQHLCAMTWIGGSRFPVIFLCHPPHSLKGLTVSFAAGTWPHRDAAGQYALYCACVKSVIYVNFLPRLLCQTDQALATLHSLSGISCASHIEGSYKKY